MIALSLFPTWFPSDEVLLAILVFLVAILFMNRGRWWTINVLAQDEAFIVGVGGFAVVGGASGYLPSAVGASAEAWIVGGALVSLLGLVIWSSDDLDVRGLL